MNPVNQREGRSFRVERILYLRDDFCAVAEDGRLVEYIPAGSDGETGRILEAQWQTCL